MEKRIHCPQITQIDADQDNEISGSPICVNLCYLWEWGECSGFWVRCWEKNLSQRYRERRDEGSVPCSGFGGEGRKAETCHVIYHVMSRRLKRGLRWGVSHGDAATGRWGIREVIGFGPTVGAWGMVVR